MDDENPPRQNRNQNIRIRHSSSSLISSTTSPLHPQIPNRAMNRPSFLNHPRGGGGEEDELQPSSSTSSFNPASRGGQRVTSNFRSSSPLGSPDSTYWGPSSVSNSYQQRGGPINSSSSSSSVVQDPCVVSSSTVDDIPPSPFSPEESSSQNLSQRRVAPAHNEGSPIMPPPPSNLPIPTPPELDQGIGANPSQGVSQKNNKNHGGSSYSSSSFSFTSSMSPLRSKIKKASSFERFSAQAQASSNSPSNNQQLLNNVSSNESNGSSLQEPNSSIMNSSVSGPPRFWDYGTTSPPKANFVSSLHESGSAMPAGTNKPYHIKKLVARLANALELERLEAAAALAASEVNSQSTSGIGSGEIVTEVGQGETGQSQSVSNNNSEPVIPSEPLMRRQLSQSPLNLTENTPNSGTIYTDTNHSSSSSGLPIAARNPVISTKNFTKKMPLTPKQKLLHRMQNEIPPSPPPQQQPQQDQHQCLLLASLQQQQHQPQHLMLSDPVHGNGLMDENSASPVNNNNDRYTNALSNYEAFIRSTTGEEFSDSMSKVDETTDPGNNQILYDSADGYNYYYGNMNILTDEIFNNNGGGMPSTSRLIHSSVIQNGVDDEGIQFHSTNTSHPNSHLEFVLGLPQDEHGSDRNDIQMENVEEMQIQQQQFLDPNDLVLVGGKSSIAESTLRNLLMMEPVSRNTSQHDEWISAAEYQNRLRMSAPVSTSIPGSNSNSSSGINSWIMNEWQGVGHRNWQGQGQPHDEQEEGMDMTMEMEKTHLNSHSLKRNLHPHSHLHLSHMDDGNLVSERDGLPLLTSIPIDLQQSFNNGVPLGKSQIMTDPSPLILNPHHRNIIMECEDEPVNLVNLEQAQVLVHHHSTAHESEDLSLPHQQNGPGDLGNSTYGSVCVDSNIIFTTTSTTSTTVAGFEPPVTQPSPPQPFVELIPGQDTNIDEKRIIRVKKKKDTCETMGDGAGFEKKPNLIPDRPVQPKSFASLPSLLSLTRMSGNGWGVVTKRNKKISVNAKFGPVEGPLKRVLKSDLETLNDTVYPVLLMVDNSGIYQLDRMDDQLTNWMKYVRRARSAEEQNLLVTEEEDGLLYFTTCRDIPSKTELKVGYSSVYAQKYNVPYFPPLENENSTENQPNVKKSLTKKIKRKLEVEEEKFVCFECDLSCVSIEELNKHLDTHVEIDGFRRPKKKAIRKFYNSLNNPAEMEPLENGHIKCEVKVESTSRRSLKKKEIERLKREQEESLVESSSPDVEEVGNFIVKISTTAQQEASSSSSIVPSKPKIKCYICYKVFATQHRLQKHMIVHSEDNLKPLKCQFCAKRFLTNSALAGHVKSHEGKSFECPLCEFTTQQLLHLKEHVQSHKNEQNGFTCPHCTKSFSCYSLVRKHIRAFHGPRLFSCEDCSMKFPTPDKLKLHELRHSSFRAYLCAECGRQFKRKDKLTDHTRKAHGKAHGISKPQQQQGTQVLPAEPSIPVQQAPKPKEISKKVIPRLTEEEISKYTFRCIDCMVGFRRRGMLVNHLAKRHPEVDVDNVPELALPITRTAKHYFCPYCERVYKSSSKRKSHILKNHPGKAVPPQVRGKDLKAILEERVGSTTLDLNLNEFEGAEMEQIKATVDQVIRKEAIVGEIIGTPHGCSFCHRQYATRAKLLQHQRKFHISLMPLEIQTPRPQKNNVKNIDQSDIQQVTPKLQVIENDEEREPSPSLIDEKEQLDVPQQSYGYLITTTSGHVTNNDIVESLLQPELFMSLLSQQNQVPASSNGSSTGTRTITLCIPSGMISSTAPTTNPTNNTQLISSGINVNGTQILTKTD